MEARLLKALRLEKAKMEQYVCEGNISTYEEYRFACGKIRAYQETLEMCIHHFGERDDDE